MISEKDLKYLKVAQSMAELSDYPQIKIGAILVNHRNIISTGCNKNKSHPIQAFWNQRMPYPIPKARLHAEVDCLIKTQDTEACGGTLYIFRRITKGLYRNCEPCKACMGMIQQKGIRRLVFTVEGGVIEKILY